MVIKPIDRERLLECLSQSSYNMAKNGDDVFWVVAMYPEGYDLSPYDFYEMIDMLNGEELPQIVKVFDNAYDAIQFRDDIACQAEAEAMLQGENDG
jgi:hypothetical protein